MKSGLYGLWVVPKNRIIFLLNNSLLPLLPGVRLLLSKKSDIFLILTTFSFIAVLQVFVVLVCTFISKE